VSDPAPEAQVVTGIARLGSKGHTEWLESCSGVIARELRSGLLGLRLFGWSRCRLGSSSRIADEAEAIDDKERALALRQATTQQPISRTHRLTAGYGDGDLVEARM
jgi:hypothetical protein